MLNKLTPSAMAEIQSRYADLINYQSMDILDPIDPITYRDSGGDSLLHIAVLRRDARTTILLLEAGLDPNIVGDLGNTPLHYTADGNCNEIADLLIKYGAKTDIKNELGNPPNVRRP